MLSRALTLLAILEEFFSRVLSRDLILLAILEEFFRRVLSRDLTLLAILEEFFRRVLSRHLKLLAAPWRVRPPVAHWNSAQRPHWLRSLRDGGKLVSLDSLLFLAASRLFRLRGVR